MNTITAHLAALAAEWQRSDDPYSMLLTADRALEEGRITILVPADRFVVTLGNKADRYDDDR